MTFAMQEHTGDRSELRPLFELAEDSAQALDAYIDAGQVLVAVEDGRPIGHVQLTDTEDPAVGEIKTMAVLESRQRHGVGAALLAAAADLARARGQSALVVATAAADVGNLRFYQRAGFRLRAVERDAFTPATGYPEPIEIDGIQLRDRVWLDRSIA